MYSAASSYSQSCLVKTLSTAEHAVMRYVRFTLDSTSPWMDPSSPQSQLSSPPLSRELRPCRPRHLIWPGLFVATLAALVGYVHANLSSLGTRSPNLAGLDQTPRRPRQTPNLPRRPRQNSTTRLDSVTPWLDLVESGLPLAGSGWV